MSAHDSNKDGLRQGDERFAEWVDGCMSDRDRERFEAELRVNARLREDLVEYERTVAIVQQALRAKTHEVSVADRVLAAIAAGDAEVRPRHSLHWRGVVWGLVCAAALLGLTVLIDAWTPKGPFALTVARSPEQGELNDQSAVDPAVGAIEPAAKERADERLLDRDRAPGTEQPDAGLLSKDKKAEPPLVEELKASADKDGEAQPGSESPDARTRRLQTGTSQTGKPSAPPAGSSTGSDDFYLGHAAGGRGGGTQDGGTPEGAPRVTKAAESDGGSRAKQVSAEPKRGDDHAAGNVPPPPSPAASSPAASGGLAPDQPVESAEAARGELAKPEVGGERRNQPSADGRVEQDKSASTSLGSATGGSVSAGSATQDRQAAASANVPATSPHGFGGIVPEIVLSGLAPEAHYRRGGVARTDSKGSGSTGSPTGSPIGPATGAPSEKSRPVAGRAGEPAGGLAVPVADVGLQFERLLTEQLSQADLLASAAAWADTPGTLRVTPMAAPVAAPVAPASDPLNKTAGGNTTADKADEAETVESKLAQGTKAGGSDRRVVERAWLIEGSREEVASVLARLGTFARTSKLEMKSGETTLPATSTLPETLSRELGQAKPAPPPAGDSKPAASAPAESMRIVLRVRLRPRQ